jgi:hypothetical protein
MLLGNKLLSHSIGILNAEVWNSFKIYLKYISMNIPNYLPGYLVRKTIEPKKQTPWRDMILSG